jgi:hypothetical protein
MIFLYFLKYDEDSIFIFRIKTCMQILESNGMHEDNFFFEMRDFFFILMDFLKSKRKLINF